jgi:3',5'-cyclic AMP phosphodiesterase CpdA
VSMKRSCLYLVQMTRFLQLILFGAGLIPYTVYAQNALVAPFLQDVTPSSARIVWETDAGEETVVYYGTTSALGDSTMGTFIVSDGTARIHYGSIPGLSPFMRYYYKARTGSWISDVYDFVTPALSSAEQDIRIIAMSDMQRDGGNPAIFDNIIQNGILPYVDSIYGPVLTDEIQMVVIPGDLVDIGTNWTQWREHFFGPSNPLFSRVPVYPVLGNHEQNAQQYFDYFILPENGTSGYEEHWWFKDYSNVRVLGMDSNPGYRIQEQLDWLDLILQKTCSDTTIDFVFAQMHHPYKSELWLAGETSYVGQIVEKMESFSTNCGKPSIHFFGHTHAYSRGQSRDHQHLWVNVATSGGNIDYWGEFGNADYDEFVISQDEYGFVMVEITAGSNPQFVLKRISIGDENVTKDNTTEDELTVRRDNTAPTAPLPLFPLVSDTVAPSCFTLKADGFSDLDGDTHGATQWQIAEDSSGFDTPVIDEWRQEKNWYFEVNTQEGDDLTDHEMSGLEGAKDFWWRVRYRDSGLKWSEWTAPIKFRTDSGGISANLLVNTGAEDGVSDWTVEIGVLESLSADECSGGTPQSGTKYFAVGALCVENPFASAFQDADVSDFAGMIDSGMTQVFFGAWLADWSGSDEPAISLEYLDSLSIVLGSSDTLSATQSTWILKSDYDTIPALTRTIRFHMMGTRYSGTDNDSYIDNVFCRIGDVEGCSTYAPAGPAHNRLYVDKDAIGIPNGESWIKAYRSLADALTAMDSTMDIQEIWVAEGTYKATASSDRSATHSIAQAIRIYGGFSGVEALLSERNPEMNQTIITGEIGDTAVLMDNTYHLFTVSGIEDTVIIDGLIIERANTLGAPDTRGAGLFVDSTNTGLLQLVNCTIQSNGSTRGAGLYTLSDVDLLNCTLSNNEASEGGHSIFNSGGTVTIENVIIYQSCNNCGAEMVNVDGGNIDQKGALNIYKN